jgi:hypothetical protein
MPTAVSQPQGRSVTIPATCSAAPKLAVNRFLVSANVVPVAVSA